MSKRIEKRPTVVPPRPAAVRRTAPKPAATRDELSTGKGTTLKTQSVKALLGAPKATPVDAPRYNVSLASALATLGAQVAPQTLMAKEIGDRPVTATPAAQAVDAAYASGGASAAAAELRKQTESMGPDDAALLVKECAPTIDRITADLGAQAADIEGGPESDDPTAQQYDQTMADLGIAADRAALGVGGTEAMAIVADAVVRHFPNPPMHYGVALGNTGELGGSGLAVAVTNSLSAQGREQDVASVLTFLGQATNRLNTRFAETADQVKEANQELAELIQQWGPLMTPQELESAITEFKNSKPEYAALDAMGAAMVGNANALPALDVGEPQGMAWEAWNQVRRETRAALENLPDTQLTTTGQAALTSLAMSAGPGFFDRLQTVGQTFGLGVDTVEAISSASMNATIAAATTAANAGDAAACERALTKLQSQAASLGIDPAEMTAVVNDLRDVRTATDATARAAALTSLNNRLTDMEARGAMPANSSAGKALRLAGLTFSVIGTYGSIAAAVADPNFLSVTQALSDSVGLAADGAQLVRGFLTSAASSAPSALGAGLEMTSKFAAGLGIAISGFQAIDAFADGNVAMGTAYAASAAGGIAMLAGGAWTGPGIILAIGGALATFFIGRIQYSNRHENESTEAFLRGGGVNPALTYELRNADSEGRGVGPRLVELANELGVPPTQLMDWVSTLSPEQVHAFCERAHQVIPNDDGSWNEGDITAFEQWARANGYQLPAPKPTGGGGGGGRPMAVI